MNEKFKARLLSFVLASIVTCVGWVCFTFKDRGGANVVIELFGLLLWPGGVLAAVVALLFSPQGGHGVEEYEWLVAPVSWLVYFAIFLRIVRRRKAKRDDRVN